MSDKLSVPCVALEDVWAARASFRPGETAHLSLLLHNQDPAARLVQLELSLRWLDEEVWTSRHQIEARAGRQEHTLPLELPVESFRGYGIDLTLRDEQGRELARRSTALDVLESWTQAPRYGFLADFAPGERNAEAVCASLARYHINIAQFYDWMWRHYALMPPEDTFVDACKRQVSLQAVRNRVAACRAQGIAAFGYAAVYGAEPEYALEHPEEMLYDAQGEPYSLGKLFYIMNIHADNPWRARMLAEMARAVREVPFDGLHLDQYGFPRADVFGPAPARVPYDLAADFPVFIDEARRAARAAQPESRVIFNAVENWPIETVAPTSQDATYIEVWPPYTSYADLQRLILDAQRLSPDKQVILAAYLAPLKEASGETLPAAEAATRLASAAIWASGGFHLLIGEQDGALCDPYYPAYASLRPEFARIMRGYYDFVVRYENALSDPRLTTLPADEASQRVQVANVKVSSRGEAGAVWAIARQMPEMTTLSLINLSAATEAAWNKPQPLPSVLHNLEIELRVDDDTEITGVCIASPEQDEGRPCQLAYRLVQHAGATWLRVTLPVLEYWSLLIIKSATHNLA